MNSHRPNVLVIGKGEYVTGLLRDGTISTDKGHGVVTLVLADLRRRELIGPRIGLCGTTGRGWTEIRGHLRRNIERFKSLSADFDTFPVDTCDWDEKAYLDAMDQFQHGDIAMVYTPDQTHFTVASEAIKRGMHVMIAKPAVISLEEHLQLADEAKRNKVLACVENHKRYDPIYAHFKQTVGALGFLSNTATGLTGALAVFVGVSGMVSVYKAVVIDKLALNCACVGGNSKAPLGIVSFAENGMMALMGLAMFLGF